MSVTAATVRTNVLEPALDGRALNLEQQRLIFNPDPEVNSLLEHINALCRERPETCAAALELLTRLVSSNQQEGERERAIALFADRLTTDLRAAELNGGPVAAVPAKQIARDTRAAFDALGTTPDLIGRFRQVQTLAGHVRSQPRAQLLAPAVRHNLGAKRFALLERIVNEREPGAGSSGPAANRGTTDGHLEA